MKQDERKKQLSMLVELFKQQCVESGGVLNEEIEETLDQALDIIAPPDNGNSGTTLELEDALFPADHMSSVDPEEFQAAMDAEIASMLRNKLSDFDAIAKERKLTVEEMEVKAKILNFLTNIENDNPRKE